MWSNEFKSSWAIAFTQINFQIESFLWFRWGMCQIQSSSLTQRRVSTCFYEMQVKNTSNRNLFNGEFVFSRCSLPLTRSTVKWDQKSESKIFALSVNDMERGMIRNKQRRKHRFFFFLKNWIKNYLPLHIRAIFHFTQKKIIYTILM